MIKIAYDVKNRSQMAGINVHQKREIASLTKLFTLYTTTSLIEEFAIKPESFKVKIGYVAESKVGTTAFLEPGDELSLYDLLFGLMLPSGNDAAVAISIAMGQFILDSRPKVEDKSL